MSLPLALWMFFGWLPGLVLLLAWLGAYLLHGRPTPEPHTITGALLVLVPYFAGIAVIG